jgi:hypothetical protein
VKPIPTFRTEQDALDWLCEEVDDPYIDNGRIGYPDDPESMAAYEKAKADGCCGSSDEDVVINGRPAIVGCNFGH